MSPPVPLPPAGFDDLTVEDRIEYVQSLWDRIAVEAGQIPLADWQEQVLAERLGAHRAKPDDARPWREAVERVRQDLRARR